jgi:hypothetical protein
MGTARRPMINIRAMNAADLCQGDAERDSEASG